MSSTKQQLADAFSLMAKGLETGAFAEAFPVGLTVPGSEHEKRSLSARQSWQPMPIPDWILC